MINSLCLEINKFIILTNYKCCYSTLNMIENKTCILPNLNNIKMLNYKKIFLYRDTITRNISLFISMIVNRFINKGEEFINDLLKNKMSMIDYNNFRNYLDKKKYIDAYKLFIDYLHLIFKLDGHIHPQTYILKTYNIDVNDINYFVNIDNEYEMTELNKLINIPNEEGTKNSILSKLLHEFVQNNTEYKNKIYNIYIEEKILFENINNNTNKKLI